MGAALTLPGGGALPILVESRTGYRNLCQLITQMKAGVAKGEGRLRLEGLEGRTDGLVALPGAGTLGRPRTRIGWPRSSASSARETSPSTSSATGGASKSWPIRLSSNSPIPWA